MAVPAAINRASAVGLETTYGTAAAIAKRFSSFGFTAARQYNVGMVRPPGSKYPMKHYLSGEWSEYGIADGVMSYDEMVYALMGIFRETTPQDAPTGSTAAVGTGGIDASATSLPAPASPAGFGTTYPFRIRVESEVMEVTAGVDTATWTVSRGQQGTTAVAHPAGATIEELTDAASRWVFDSDSFAKDPNQSYTIETGDTANNRGGQAVGGEFVEWGYEVSRDGDSAEMSGSLIGQAIEPGPLTASGILLADFEPIVPAHFEVYIDDNFADLGTTRIENAFNLGFSIGDRRNPVWLFNRAKKGYSQTVEQAPDRR